MSMTPTRFEVVEAQNWHGDTVYEVHLALAPVGSPISVSYRFPVLRMSGKPWRTRSLKRANAVVADMNRMMRIRSFLNARKPWKVIP